MVGKIFLSYAREDLDLVRWEAQTMQMLGHEVFLDVDSLRAGVDWPDTLRDEIRSADRFILFWSAFSARSEWVKIEYTTALAVRESGQRPLFLQIIRLDREALPEALSSIQVIDRSAEERILLVTDEVHQSYLMQGLAGLLGPRTLIHLQSVTPRTVRVVAQKAEEAVAAAAGGGIDQVREAGRLPAHFAFPAYRARERRRKVIFVPGFMGSQLQQGGKRIWLDAFSLALGGMERLRIGTSSVNADGLVSVGNAFFIDQLGLTTQVVAWPYDWRRSVADVADQLAVRLRDLVATERDSELVFVGFGHGCAVLRALAAFHRDLWHQARCGGAPVIFVAPSEHGTWRAAEILLNGSQILNTIGLLDLKHTARQIHELFAGFPAVLEMLPSSPAADLFAPEWWRDKARQPAEFALQQARQTRTALLAAIAPAEILCVLGESAHTPARVTVDADGLRWLNTSGGDGSTPWALGVLPGVRAFRATMDANEILDNPVAVRAISDLIDHGVTNLLPPHAPAPR